MGYKTCVLIRSRKTFLKSPLEVSTFSETEESSNIKIKCQARSDLIHHMKLVPITAFSFSTKKKKQPDPLRPRSETFKAASSI
jgi:hypothetical protein